MKSAFSDCHPAVNFLYFLLVLGFSMFCMHPVCLLLSLIGAVACGGALLGADALRRSLRFALPMLLLSLVINPLFTHEGITTLCYLPGGNPLTLESIVYGLASGVMLFSVISWFSICNHIMTSDKFVYLFGKVAPALSLILSMALRFVPRFLEQFRSVGQAQRALGQDISQGKPRQRLHRALSQTSILITWALENAVDTADSMKSRGYGLPGRTAFSIYRFTRRDLVVLLWLSVLGSYLILGLCLGGLRFTYYPSLSALKLQPYQLSLFAVYLALCLTPALLGLLEDRKWNSLQSTI